MGSMKDLFGGELYQNKTPVRSSDPETSHHYARRIAKERTELQMEVLRAHGDGKPRTLIDIQFHFNDHGSTYRSRVRELEDLGLLCTVGKKSQADRDGKFADRTLRRITDLGLSVLKACA